MSRGTFRVDLSTNNDAFEDEPGELVRILRDLADRLEAGDVVTMRNNGGYMVRLRDVNGARVGSAEFEPEPVPVERDRSEDQCWRDSKTGYVFHYCQAQAGQVTNDAGEVVDTFTLGAR